MYVCSFFDKAGIRPAFYLNESAIAYSSGSGTIEDPYILDGTLPITVYYNENEILFDQPPIIENDRVLVPMRAIFEKLGAEVEWDEESKTVTATQDETNIVMQAGNTTLIKNGEEITLDAPPQIVNERTLVPVRAVSESFDAEVDWNSYITRVIITK